MATKSTDKSNREGLTLVQLMDMFPTEATAVAWFEECLWPEGRYCGKCGSVRTREVPNAKPMPYWCTDCRSYFSVRTGTPLARSNVPMRKWAIAIYLCLTSLKSVTSKKLARDIGVNKSTAWVMMHRMREAWGEDGDEDGDEPFDGPVEVDETYMGGKRKNMPNAKRKELAGTGRGAVGKTAVVGIKDRATNEVRAEVVTETDAETLQDFVEENTEEDATVYTDTRRRTRASSASMSRSVIRSPNTSAAKPIPTGSNRSGPCSRERTPEPSTRSARSICNATSPNSPGNTTSESQTLSSRCGIPSPGSSVAISSTAT